MFLIVNGFLLAGSLLCIPFFIVSKTLFILVFLLLEIGWLINNLVTTKKFQFDSTSEVLSIITSHPFINKHSHRSKIFAEFPKERLLNYKMKRALFKTYLRISFKRETELKPSSYTMSFYFYKLNNMQQLRLENELTKIITKNNEFI